MSKKLTSAPSIEACLQQLERKEQRDQQSKHQYMINLRTQCQIRQNALRTAQSLILAYQKENDALKEQNQHLRGRVVILQSESNGKEQLSATVKSMEKTLFKYSQKINDLFEKNIANQQKIHQLERELQKAGEAQLANEAERAKAKLKAKEERHRRELQGQFKNYLRLPHGEQSSFVASLVVEESKSERKLLEWKSKQKDEEIIILLKRLKDMEEKLDGLGKRGRNLTYDSMDAASTKLSKKMNVSEFQH